MTAAIAPVLQLLLSPSWSLRPSWLLPPCCSCPPPSLLWLRLSPRAAATGPRCPATALSRCRGRRCRRRCHAVVSLLPSPLRSRRDYSRLSRLSATVAPLPAAVASSSQLSPQLRRRRSPSRHLPPPSRGPLGYSQLSRLSATVALLSAAVAPSSLSPLLRHRRSPFHRLPWHCFSPPPRRLSPPSRGRRSYPQPLQLSAAVAPRSAAVMPSSRPSASVLSPSPAVAAVRHCRGPRATVALPFAAFPPLSCHGRGCPQPSRLSAAIAPRSVAVDRRSAAFRRRYATDSPPLICRRAAAFAAVHRCCDPITATAALDTRIVNRCRALQPVPLPAFRRCRPKRRTAQERGAHSKTILCHSKLRTRKPARSRSTTHTAG
jgi:hypothetical protein